MLIKIITAMALAAALLGILASAAAAGVPFPPLSTCTITITQYPTRTACISNNDPDVVRLTPAGSTASPIFDRVSIAARVRDAAGQPVAGAAVLFTERSGVVNIANGGATTAITDPEGAAAVVLHAASGYGLVGLCADGVLLCSLEIRSPDVNQGASTSFQCGIGTGVSTVSGSDITNTLCGYLANFGTVTPGVNNAWDIDCSGSVAGADINGGISGRGSVLQYFGDVGTLGARNECSLP